MAVRPKIAFLTPYAFNLPNRGGRIRDYHLWRAMAAYAEVMPFVIGDVPQSPYRFLARAAGTLFYPRRRIRGAESPRPGLWEVLDGAVLSAQSWDDLRQPDSLVRHCLNSARVNRIMRQLRSLQPDLVVLSDSTIGLLAPRIRALGLRVVVTPHNHDSSLYAAMSVSAPTNYLRQWNAAASAAFDAAERLFAPHAEQLWVCSVADAGRFSALVPRERCYLVPNVFDLLAPTDVPVDSTDLVFVGQANYYPNERAIRDLLTVSQGLDARGIVHRMRIVGRTRDAIRDLAKSAPSVEVVGEVDAVGPYVAGAALMPIPLTLGGGTRLKILEAMASARPVLSTPIGIEGIDAENGVHAVVEPDLAAFPDRIVEMLADRQRSQKIATAAWELARDHYSPAALLGLVGGALRALGLNERGPSASTFASNAGATVIEEDVWFNPHSRLLVWTLLVRVAATFDDVQAEFDFGRGEVSNAFVTIKRRPHGLIGLEASAILPAEIAPETATIKLSAWGWQVLRRMPRKVRLQNGGLLSMDPDTGSVRVRAWSTDTGAMFDPPTDMEPVPTPTSLPGVSLLTASYRLAGPAFSVGGGVGEASFDHVAEWLGMPQPSSARLRALQDCHAGQTAWLIGNGPSVRTADLDCLQGRITFCFNRFHLARGTTQLRPTYTLTADKQMIEDFGQEIVDESGGMVFVIHDRAPDLLGSYIWVRQAPVFPPLFSKFVDRVVSPGGSTPFVAMQLAYFMGIRKLYFYGADFSFTFYQSGVLGDGFRVASGEGNHFIPNYRAGRPWCPPSLRDIGASFLNARLAMEADGGFIRNVTHGGKLEIFSRETFDNAIAAI